MRGKQGGGREKEWIEEDDDGGEEGARRMVLVDLLRPHSQASFREITRNLRCFSASCLENPGPVYVDR